LTLPEGAGPFRVVALIHGGFWRARYRRNLMDGLVDDLVARGVAAYNVEYRRLDAGGGWPESADDVVAAIDHLATLDAPIEPGADVVGHSAGGHLALIAGAEGRARRVVGQAPVADVELAIEQELGEGVVRRFADGADLDAVSPVRRAPLGVPVLLVHGEQDHTVPPSQSEALVARGGDVDLRVRRGDGHFEHIDPSSGAWGEVAAWLAS